MIFSFILANKNILCIYRKEGFNRDDCRQIKIK